MIAIPLPAGTASAQATAYLEGAEASAVLPALYSLGAGSTARGALLAVRVDGQEIHGLSGSVTLAVEQLSSFGLELSGRPATWDDLLQTLGTPMGDRPVEIGLLIGKSFVPIMAQGMADSADVSLSWDERESYQGIGREARYQRAAVDLNLMPGHGWSYRRMLASILPDLEMPPDALLDAPRYKQVAFTAQSPLAIAHQLLDWTAYRVVAGRNGLRLIDSLKIGAPKAINPLGGDAKVSPKTDIPTRCRVLAWQDVVDLAPPATIAPVTSVLPLVKEIGVLSLPAISSQTATTGTMTSIRGAIAQPDVLLSRISGIAKSLGDTVVYQRQQTEGFGQQETARYSQDTDGALTPVGPVVVETGADSSAAAYNGDSVFGVREISESWDVFDWVGATYPAGSGSPWEVLRGVTSFTGPGPGNGYKLGAVSSSTAYHLTETAVKAYDTASGSIFPREVFVTGDGRGAGETAFPARVAALVEVARTVQVISPADDNDTKVGKVTTWDLQMGRAPGGAFVFADGAGGAADQESLRIVRVTTETYVKVGDGWQKITQTQADSPVPTKIETVDSRPDRERLKIAPDGTGNAPVVRRDQIKVEVDTGLAAYGHPDRMEVLSLDGPESIEEATYAAEVYLKRACGMPITGAAYAPDALADPADTLQMGRYVFVLDQATYSQEGGSAPICRFSGLIPWGGL